MSRTELKNKNYSKELAAFIRSGLSKEELRKRLSNYHENDIADALERLTAAERKRLYQNFRSSADCGNFKLCR